MQALRFAILLRPHTQCGLGTVMCALLLAGCGGDNLGPRATANPASITLSPSTASLSVGQTQTITAEAKDQNGTVLSGVSLTWASSDSGVATVSGGVATGVAPGTASITASNGGVTSNAVTLTVTLAVGATNRVVIDKASVLLPAVGESAQLTGQILDPQGVPVAGGVTWTSSAPDKVSVDAGGRLVANAIGAAQIFAEAGGIRSAPSLVFVARPEAGALLVTDAQVVSVGPPLDLAPGAFPGVGTQFEVTLQGVTAPAPGTVVLAAETAPVAGQVVSTRQDPAGLVVRLAIAPLYQLFSEYDIALDIELAPFQLGAVPEGSAQFRLSQAWNAARGKPPWFAAAHAFDVIEPFRAFDCDASIKPKLVSTSISLSAENQLTLTLDDRPGYSKHALQGSAALVGSAGLKLAAGFEASGSCNAQAQIRLPVFGWFSVIAMPAVRFGLGAAVEGKVLVVQGDLGVEGKVGFSPVVGWECGGAQPACRALDDMAPLNEFKTKSHIPSEHDMQAKVSGQFYVVAGLDASILSGLHNARILEARIGPEQSFDLGFEEDQAVRTDYASSYDLKLKGVVEPGEELKKAIKLVIDDDAVGVSFKAEFSTDISESPKGSFSASKALVRPNDAVDFTVDITPSTAEYFLLGFNVTGVELYRKREDEAEFTPWKSMSMIATYRATYHWVPVEADAGKYQFVALVNTQIPTPLLEVNPNSIQAVEVSCFSAASVTLLSSSSAPPTCADTWIGTSTVIIKTVGLPDANITSNATNLTWIFDPSTTGNGTTGYTLQSGSFDLALNSEDPSCSFSLSPSSFTYVKDPLTPSILSITNNGITAPVYSFLATQRVDFTTTAKCAGREDVVTPFVGFIVNFAQGGGSYTPGQTTLSGSSDDGAIESHWNFTRP